MNFVTKGNFRYIIAFMALILGVAGSSGFAQPTLNFKSINVAWPEIQLHFQASCMGTPKYDLDKSMVKVFDGGVEVPDFTMSCPDPTARCPISVALVFDESSSMSGGAPPRGIDIEKESGHAFIDLMDGIQDQASVFGFNDAVHTLSQMTTLKPVLNSALDQLAANGGTALWDGIWAGMNEIVQHGTNPCSAIIVMTDGGDNASLKTSADVITYANSHSIRIFAVNLGSYYNTVLDSVTQQTDGKFYFATSSTDVASTLQEISTIIFQGFQECIITYQSSCKDGSLHAVELQINNVCGGSDSRTKTYNAPKDTNTFTPLEIAIGKINTFQNTDVSVPITLKTNMYGGVFQTSSFTVTYDVNTVQYSGYATPPGTLLAGIPIIVAPIAGGISFRITQNRALNDTGALAFLSFKTRDLTTSTESKLAFANWQFDLGCFKPVLKNGALLIDVGKISCPISDSGYLSFGKVGIGLTRTRTVTITNKNPNPLKISSFSITGVAALLYSFLSGASPVTLKQGDVLSVVIQYAPTAAGASSVLLTIDSDDPEHPAYDIFMDGAGVPKSPPNIECSVANFGVLDFGSVPVHAFNEQSVIISNSGDSTLLVSALTLSGAQVPDFSITRGAGTHTIPGSSSDTITLRFSPGARGTRSALLSIASDDPVTPAYQIYLQGNGVPDKYLPIIVCSTPDSGIIDFGKVAVGGSCYKKLLVSNSGDSALLVGSPSIDGANGSDFSISSGGGNHVIAPGNTDTLTLHFNPAATGARIAELTLLSNDSTKLVYTIGMTGTGVTANYLLSADPLLVDYGVVRVGSDKALSVTLQNTGILGAGLMDQTIYGRDSLDFIITRPASATIPVGGSDFVTVLFRPASGGVKSAELRLQYFNTPTLTTISINLAGVGAISDDAAISITTDTLDFGTTDETAPVTGVLTVSNLGLATLIVQGQTITGPHSYYFTALTATPAAIDPGNAKDFQYLFSPKLVGDKKATLTISSNDPARPQRTIAMHGRCIAHTAPTIWSSTQVLDFGKVLVGTTKIDSLVVMNIGSADLMFTTATLTGASEFTNLIQMPILLTSLDSSTLVFSFSPQDLGPKTATYEINSNDPLNPKYDIRLIGNSVTGIEDGQPAAQSMTLEQNYPNPFNVRTSIRYSLPAKAYVSLAVYDLFGRKVAVLQEAAQSAGRHEISFDRGALPAGAYYLRMTAGGETRSVPIMIE